jgi:crotonobetainyl-CoA:carnitine CoA-transferase CaiB-like acyl-CoA transferase
VTVGPVYDMSNIETDPHFHARQIVVELPDDALGTVPVHNISPRLMDTPGRFRHAAPQLGEHSRQVLQEAGYSKEEVELFVTEQAVSAPPRSLEEV